MTTERHAIAPENKWDVETFYPSLAAWQQELDQILQQNKPVWPKIARFKGQLKTSPDTIKEALESLFEVERKLNKLYTYAHLRHDEDIAENAHKTAYARITALYHQLAEETAWFEPELLGIDEKTLEDYLKTKPLEKYRFHIEKLIRIKKHTLSDKEEELVAQAAKALDAPHKAFSALNDADFLFDGATDAHGHKHPVTHARYALHIRSQDRILRENAFNSLHKKYQEYENTLCELLNGQVQTHLFFAKAKKYSTCLDAALFPKNIEPAVYHTLITTVNDGVDALHRYMDLRKKTLKLDKLKLHDLYVPLTSDYDKRICYQEAENLVIDSVAPLGQEYQQILKDGMQKKRWVDRYENKNKRSGAYSSGCYDSEPYILMNYKDVMRDVFTLAHEAGHSMHSKFSNTHQPYHSHKYPIFLAEVASTFNEELLMRKMLAAATSKEEKIFLLNEKIEDIRGTLFRQTLFAEFELTIHTLAENQTPLTPQLLKETYLSLCKKYFGPAVEIDSIGEIEWARIPHFYYNFYVFQYATGISAALALAEKVCEGGAAERDAYLSFLKGGASKYPIDMLKSAGVDMRSPEPICLAINRFRKLVSELDILLAEH